MSYIEKLIPMVTVVLLKQVSLLNGGEDVTCAETAAYMEGRGLAEYDTELPLSNSRIVRMGWREFAQADDQTRNRVLLCVRLSLAAEGDRVVPRDEIVTFTYKAGEHNQKKVTSEIIHKKAMTLLLEREPFRYLAQGIVLSVVAMIIVVLTYAPFEPFITGRNFLLDGLNSKTLSSAQSFLASFCKVAVFYTLPVLTCLTALFAFVAAYMCARELAKQSSDEMQERRKVYNWLNETVERERKRRKPSRLLSFTIIMLVVCFIIGVIMPLLPLAGSTTHAITRPAAYLFYIALLALPFAMFSKFSYYEEKAREWLRSKLILRSPSISG